MNYRGNKQAGGIHWSMEKGEDPGMELDDTYSLPRVPRANPEFIKPNMVRTNTPNPMKIQPVTLPTPPAKDKIDPYFLLKGATTGLDWLSQHVERNRQDNYMASQYSTLGQVDPANVNDYQPTNYNPYMQQGGALDFEKKWMNSPVYQTRNVPASTTAQRGDAINSLGAPVQVTSDYLKGFLPKGVKGNPPAMYNSDKHSIEYSDNIPTVLSHEYFHGTTRGDKLIPSSENINSEQRAALQNLRYSMYNQGVPVLDREVNQGDLDQMKGSEEYKYLKNMFRRDSNVLDFLKSTSSNSQEQLPVAKEGGWIKGAVNPAHKGYCTPMTKSTCTGHRKAFAKRAKAHFKQEGGTFKTYNI